MARILSSLIGDLRGSIGGQTYSRNKAGAFIRQRVKPVNPQTVRQQNARYRFGNMSILFQSLSAAQKTCWENFAKSHFNPLKGNNTGIYSAGNAFVALRQSAGQGNAYRTNPVMKQLGNTIVVTAINYNETTDPPLAPSSATIKTDNDIIVQFDISNIEIGGDGTYLFDMTFPSLDPTSQETFSQFQNAEGQQFGIGIYVSNILKFEGAKPNTALKTNFADTGVINEVLKGGDAVQMSNKISISGTTGLVKEDIRDFPCAGDVVLASVFLRTQDGAQKLIKTQYVTAVANVSQ